MIGSMAIFQGVTRRRRVRAAIAGTALILGMWNLIVSDTANAAIRPSEWHWASIHGHKIYYAVKGQGPTLLLLHGGGDSGEHSFARQLDGFSEHHRLGATDQIGQGRATGVA